MWRMDYSMALMSQHLFETSSKTFERLPTASDLMPFTEEPIATEDDMKRMFGIKD